MKRVFRSIWFISAIIAVPILFFLPPMFEKFEVKELSREPLRQSIRSKNVFYSDLKGNGNELLIQAGEVDFYDEPRTIIEVSQGSPGILLKGKMNRKERNYLYFNDMNKDGFQEILAFSFVGDSLFLNICAPYTPESKRFNSKPESIFVPFTYNQQKFNFSSVLNGIFYDLDKDGYNEFLFSVIYHGVGRPGQLFVYDRQENKIKESKITSGGNTELTIADIDNDNEAEIFSSLFGEGELSDYLFGDGYAHLKHYNANLEIQSESVRFPKGNVTSVLMESNGINYHFSLWYNNSDRGNYKLYKSNQDGELLDSCSFVTDEHSVKAWLGRSETGDLLISVSNGEVKVFSQELEYKKTIVVKSHQKFIYFDNRWVYDINEDGIYDYLCVDFDNKECFILSDSFQEKIVFGQGLKMMPQINFKIGKGRFYGFDDEYAYTYLFRRNPFRLLQIPVFAGIYFFIILVTFVIRKTQEAALKEKYELREKVKELQYRALKNQLDPHFIFNTFNTIASAIQQGKNDEAYDLMVRFSKLVRMHLEETGSIFTTLQNEIKFVTDYLSIQKVRFKTLFNYTIKMDKSVNQYIEIPRLLVQVHVENALKHGLRPAKKQGSLIINVFQNQDNVVIEIEDDGIGREKSKELNNGGMQIGIRTIEQALNFYNKNTTQNITQQIVDLFDANNNPTGTKVILKISKNRRSL